MRIVIADDEKLARASLLSMLDELDLPLEFVGEASNGAEMLRLVEGHQPDVAFVDISMPGLSGLEAIKLARPCSPQTRWFILTGFPEFDYAQAAIRLGVSGYLLKPINPRELRNVLGEFIEEDRRRKLAQNRQFERELIALHYSLTSLDHEDPQSIMARGQFVGALFYFDSHAPEKRKAERQAQISQRLRELLEQSLENYDRIALIVLPSGELATIGAWLPTHDRQAERRVRAYFQAVEQAACALDESDLAVTMLLSESCCSYQELHDQLERLRRLAPMRIVAGVGKQLPLATLHQYAQRPGLLELSMRLIQLQRLYQERNYLNYMSSLQQLDSLLQKLPAADLAASKLALAAFFQRALGCRLALEQSLKQWLAALQAHGEGLLHELSREEPQSVDLIDQVIAFIDENYMRDIGIGQIAERLDITPNYLSTLFHKKTGVNFMAYLKKVRMLKAKELLTDPGIQIQKVAEQVGYFSARHFARLFAEQFGCLPSEYRDSLRQRAEAAQ